MSDDFELTEEVIHDKITAFTKAYQHALAYGFEERAEQLQGFIEFYYSILDERETERVFKEFVEENKETIEISAEIVDQSTNIGSDVPKRRRRKNPFAE